VSGRCPEIPTEWALAFLTHCPEHLQHLTIGCPNCNAIGHFGFTAASSTLLCAGCGQPIPLRSYPCDRSPAIVTTVSLQVQILRATVEFPVNGRRVDILAKDKAGMPVVIELKVSRGHERTIGQALYYRATIKEIFKVATVRIFIVTLELSSELRVAAKEVPDVSLFEYSLAMTIKHCERSVERNRK